MNPLLEARDLVRQFPGVRAVDGISLQLQAGQCLGLLGPNGAGKTTTLEMLEGLQTPTSGSILYRGQPLDFRYREEIGIQFQATSLQEFQNVGEALTMFASLYTHTADRDELIELCNLGELLDRDTHKLSGGQLQRLLLAIALINDPALVFLDEPTTGLDPQSRHNFWELIERVRKRGTTILLTTHYMEEAERLCDHIAIVDHGRIIAEGSPCALIREHFPAAIIRLPEDACPSARTLPGNVLVRDGWLEIHTEEVGPRITDLERMGADLSTLRVAAPNLEDLFLKLTGHALRT